MTDTATEVDGRRLRRENNRDAVLDALASMFRDGLFGPSANEIAERAGISPRSLFRYFDDIEDLSRACIEREMDAARPLLDHGVDPHAPLDEKIVGLVEARARLFETSGPAARAARVGAHRNPLVATLLRDTRSLLRQQVRDAFAPQLTGERAELQPVVEALCSFETYELMRHDQGLSRPKAVAAIVNGLHALLAP